MLKKAVLALAVACWAAFAVPTLRAEDLKEINFGIISTESTQNLKAQWQPLLDDMQTAMGVPVKAYFAPDYAGIIEAMRFKKVDVAWYGNKSAMEAVDRAGAEVFVQTTGRTAEGEIELGYYSLLVTHKDTPLNSVQDVLKCDQSLTFGNGDPNSTSGFLVPAYYVFGLNKVDAKACYKAVRSANHETNLLAVANKQVDFATNNTENLARFAKTHPEEAKKVKVIWQSPLIPKDPITYRADLDREWKSKIKAFFLAYGRLGPNAAKEQEVLKAIGQDSWLFYDSSNAQLYPIRQLELFKERLKVEGDAALSDADKQAKLAEIDRKLDVVRILSQNQGPIVATN
jgi:phosphonate transport system substrate-binding protein